MKYTWRDMAGRLGVMAVLAATLLVGGSSGRHKLVLSMTIMLSAQNAFAGGGRQCESFAIERHRAPEFVRMMVSQSELIAGTVARNDLTSIRQHLADATKAGRSGSNLGKELYILPESPDGVAFIKQFRELYADYSFSSDFKNIYEYNLDDINPAGLKHLFIAGSRVKGLNMEGLAEKIIFHLLGEKYEILLCR